MADKPILFSGPMVRAILDGRKTQTRRVLKPQPDNVFRSVVDGRVTDMTRRVGYSLERSMEKHESVRAKFAAGHRLWVKENYQLPAILNTTPTRKVSSQSPISYPATDGRVEDEDGDGNRIRVRPSIHMPRWASRLTLTVTDVRVQRLQEISVEDAIAEGIRRDRDGAGTFIGREGPDRWVTPWCSAKEAFADLWDSINGKTYPWESNPWVAAYTFTAEKRNIDNG